MPKYYLKWNISNSHLLREWKFSYHYSIVERLKKPWDKYAKEAGEVFLPDNIKEKLESCMKNTIRLKYIMLKI